MTYSVVMLYNLTGRFFAVPLVVLLLLRLSRQGGRVRVILCALIGVVLGLALGVPACKFSGSILS